MVSTGHEGMVGEITGLPGAPPSCCPASAPGGRLAAHVLGFAEQAITPETRAPRIGPPLTVAPGAPVTHRLVAFLSRTP